MKPFYRDTMIVFLCIAAALSAFMFMRSFILTALFVYVIPNVWIFFHLRKIIAGRYLRNAVLITFILLATAFPAGELLENTTPSAFSSFYSLAGYLYLPFLLYFVLAVPVLRLIFYIAGKYKIISFKGVHSRLIAASAISAIFSLIITEKNIFSP